MAVPWSVWALRSDVSDAVPLLPTPFRDSIVEKRRQANDSIRSLLLQVNIWMDTTGPVKDRRSLKEPRPTGTRAVHITWLLKCTQELIDLWDYVF